MSSTLAALVLAGCAGGPGAPAAAPRAVVSAATPSRPAPRVSPDDPICTGVQAVIGHLTADTAGWSPLTDPFDTAVSRRIRLRSAELARQAPANGSRRIVEAVDATASAFTHVATAMRSEDRSRVARAINRSRVAYRALKRACPPQ